jgi:hypothetical protein
MRFLLPALLAVLAGCGDDMPACPDQDAEALVTANQACETNEDCVIVDMDALVGENNCVGAFQCGQSLRADADLDAFVEEAGPIVDGQDACGECAMASCVAPSDLEAFCSKEGRCDQRPLDRFPDPDCLPSFGDHCSCAPQCLTPEEIDAITDFCDLDCGDTTWTCEWGKDECVVVD